jgi:hypothetical protein
MASAKAPIREHVCLDVLAIDGEALAIEVAQRRVQDGTILGHVNVLARKHRRAAAFDIGGPGQFFQQFHRAGVDSAFRPVEQKIAVGGGKPRKPRRIGGKYAAHVP